jgi:Kdo2-lipid IVA lauroyltransferase/acyltransferase
MNSFREKSEYFLARAYFTLLRYSPAPVIYGICRLVARLIYLAAGQRRQITLANLDIAFPDLPAAEKRRTARAVFDHFGQFVAESAMILAGKIRQEDLLGMVDGDELSRVLELEKRTEKGILFITGHLGNFELLAHYTGLRMKRSGYVVARQGTNRLIDRKIVTPMRESFGNRVIYKERALPQVARALRRGEHAGLLVDIKSNRRHGVPITLFGEPTYALKSSAYLQIKLGVPVVPLAMVRTAPGHYRLVVGDVIERVVSGKPADEQIAELTQQHQTALEKMILHYPEQWLWMHNRFKLPDSRTRRRKTRRIRRTMSSV